MGIKDVKICMPTGVGQLSAEMGWKTEGKKKTMYDPARIRTWNPLIGSKMPYPLGLWALRRE